MTYVNRLEATGFGERSKRPEFKLGIQNLIEEIIQHGTIANADNIIEKPPYNDFRSYLMEEAWRNAKLEKVDPMDVPDWIKEAIYKKLIFMRDEARRLWMESHGKEKAHYMYDVAMLPTLEGLTQPSP